MTNDQLNRERLEKIKSWRETYGAGSNVMLPAEEAEELARIALAAMDSEPVAYTEKHEISNMHATGLYLRAWPADRARNAVEGYTIPLYTTPQPIPEVDSEPVAYIFKHPAGRLFWALTDERNKGQSDVMPVYASPEPASVVPEEVTRAIEGLKQVLVDCNRYNYCSDAVTRVESACRAAMLQSAENTESRCGIQTAPALDSSPKTAESRCGNSPVIPEGYVMVPKEPTEAMMLHNSGCQHHAWDDPDCAMRQTRRLIWSHMLAAAPQEVQGE